MKPINKAQVEGSSVLLVEGVPQSAYPAPRWGYWQFMVPENFKGKHVLLLGVAAGTIARLLLKKYPKVKIIGVDNNSQVLTAARLHFGLGEIKMKIEIADGFEYVKRAKRLFDLIIVDMWDGTWFPIKSLSSQFISDCQKILAPGGQVYINAPNLDFLAQESLKGKRAYRNDIGRNIIYSWQEVDK